MTYLKERWETESRLSLSLHECDLEHSEGTVLFFFCAWSGNSHLTTKHWKGVWERLKQNCSFSSWGYEFVVEDHTCKHAWLSPYSLDLLSCKAIPRFTNWPIGINRAMTRWTMCQQGCGVTVCGKQVIMAGDAVCWARLTKCLNRGHGRCLLGLLNLSLYVRTNKLEDCLGGRSGPAFSFWTRKQFAPCCPTCYCSPQRKRLGRTQAREDRLWLLICICFPPSTENMTLFWQLRSD